MGAILYTGIDRLVYGATLDDSKECVNEVLAKSRDVADASSNSHINIISEVEREEAVKVLENGKIGNGIYRFT